MSDKNKLIKSIGGFCLGSMIVWFIFYCIFPFLMGLYYRIPLNTLIKEISQNLPYVLLAPLDIVFWVLSIILKGLIGAILMLCICAILIAIILFIKFIFKVICLILKEFNT